MVELRRGEFPNTPALVFGLRSKEPLPVEVREFLAKWVGGEIKRPQGRPRRAWLDREFTGNYVRSTYELMKEFVAEALAGGEHLVGTPSDIALEWTQERLLAEGEDFALDTIRDIIKRRHGWEV